MMNIYLYDKLLRQQCTVHLHEYALEINHEILFEIILIKWQQFVNFEKKINVVFY